MLMHMYDLSFNAEVFHSFDYVCARVTHMPASCPKCRVVSLDGERSRLINWYISHCRIVIATVVIVTVVIVVADDVWQNASLVSE